VAARLPTSITILGTTFSIEWDVSLAEGDWGESHVLERSIKIGNVCNTPQKRADTLLHEIIHCVLGLTGHADRFSSEAEEEALVVALENGLMSTLPQILAVSGRTKGRTK
jgi:hypothetical protein